MSDTKINDLSPLAQADTLVNLSLSRTPVEDLEPLRDLGNLRVLGIEDCPIRSLAPLRNNQVLSNLSLDGANLDDYGILSNFGNLSVLSLERASIGDLGPLSTLKKLSILNICDTPVTNLSPLADLNGLRALWIERTAVSDINPLRSHEKLSALRLSGTAVNDLTPLDGLRKLTSVWLNDTQALKDLTPIAELPLSKYPDLMDSGLYFRGCGAASSDPEGLGKLAEMENHRKRTELTLAYLRKMRSGATDTHITEQDMALTAEALPEMLFFPAVQKDLRAMGLGIGTVSALLEDPDGKLAMIAWSKAEDAVEWLKNGGFALWQKNPRPPSGGQIVVVGNKTAEFLNGNHTAGGSEKYLHFEPARGELFAPPDRRLKLS